MTPALIFISVGLLLLLVFQRRRINRRLARLSEALRSHDRTLLGEKAFHDAPPAFRELEKHIFEQLFEAENLEKRIGRREILLEAVVDGLADAVLVFDGDLTVRFSNPSASRLFGWSEPPIGRRASECILNFKLVDMIDEAVTKGRAASSEITQQIDSADGQRDEVLTLEVDIAPLMFGEAENVSRVRVILHDVSDARQLEQVRKDFVANASHELRTPLTIINGYLENLVDEGVGNRELAERVLPVMQKHGIRISHIIEDMLTISKLESSTEVLTRERFDLKKCAQEVADRLSTVVEQRRAEIRLEFPADDSFISGDAFYWDQIFFNLIDNAIKENEGPGLVITVSMRRFQDHNEVRVSDSGVGIPQAALPHVFKRFYRVDKNRSADKKGTGLGLSIVKRAVEAHSGSISVESTPGKRTEFTMTLPHGDPQAGLAAGQQSESD